MTLDELEVYADLCEIEGRVFDLVVDMDMFGFEALEPPPDPENDYERPSTQPWGVGDPTGVGSGYLGYATGDGAGGVARLISPLLTQVRGYGRGL